MGLSVYIKQNKMLGCIDFLICTVEKHTQWILSLNNCLLVTSLKEIFSQYIKGAKDYFVECCLPVFSLVLYITWQTFSHNYNGLIMYVHLVYYVFIEIGTIISEFFKLPKNNSFLHIYSAYVSFYVCVKITSSHVTSFSGIKFQGLFPLRLLGGRRWEIRRGNFHLTAMYHAIRYFMGDFMSPTKIANIGHFQKWDIGLIRSLVSFAMVISVCLRRMMCAWFEYMSENREHSPCRLLESYHARNSYTTRFLTCQCVSFPIMVGDYIMMWEEVHTMLHGQKPDKTVYIN